MRPFVKEQITWPPLQRPPTPSPGSPTPDPASDVQLQLDDSVDLLTSDPYLQSPQATKCHENLLQMYSPVLGFICTWIA